MDNQPLIDTKQLPGITELEREVRDWNESNRPRNTLKGIKTYSTQFREWCQQRGLCALPATPATVAAFLKWCAIERQKPLAKSTITKAVTSAIANDHKSHGLPSPTLSQLVKQTKQTVNRVGKEGRGGKHPISLEMLKKMVAYRNEMEFEAIRDRFMIVLMFAAALRPDEAVRLKLIDIRTEEWLDEQNKHVGIMYVLINKSKTDQERRGDTVIVSAVDDLKICPIHSFDIWRRCMVEDSEWLLHDINGGELKPDKPNKVVKSILTDLKIDTTKYGGHSMRKGAATAAVAAGIDMHLLKRHGRWKSDAVYVYVFDSIGQKMSVSQAIMSGCKPANTNKIKRPEWMDG